MTLAADRFLLTRDRRAIDLVTGAPVTLRVVTGESSPDETRWWLRCDALHNIHQASLAPLLDYGVFNRSARFEAWGCAAPWTGSRRTADAASTSVARFFRACGWSTDGDGLHDVFEVGGRPLVVPRHTSGCPDGAPSAPHEQPMLSAADYGLAWIERPADRAMAELFRTLVGARPHLLRVCGVPRAGCTTALLRAARQARLQGFVPVGVRMLASLDRRLLAGRRVCLVAIDTSGVPWSALLAVALESPRAHVWLCAGAESRAAGHDVQLGTIPSERLAGAVRPDVLSNEVRSRVERAATRAQGLPACFSDLLWGRQAAASPRAQSERLARSRVAESPAVYAPDESCAQTRPADRVCDAAELEVARQRARMAGELVRRGRHEQGIRQLRQAIGALARRRDWSRAAAASLALAGACLGRGDARRAQEAIAWAKGWADRAGDERLLIDAAVLAGHAWIDLARLDEAEAVITTALSAAKGGGDAERVAAASLALARCQFWRGAFAESLALATVVRAASRPTAIALAAVAARAAVGAKDLPRAMAFAVRAAEEAGELGDAALSALAGYASAFVHAAANDLERAAIDARASIALARAAHDPVRALRARLLLVECERRRGRAGAAQRLVRRLEQMTTGRLTPLLGARIALLKAIVAEPRGAAAIVARHTARSALPGLALYAGDGRNPQRPHYDESATEEVIAILRACQTAEDEATVLKDVAARLRRQLHAAAVAIMAGEGASVAVLAADGGRGLSAVGERAMTGALTIAPRAGDEGIESAVPVRYGGEVVGAIAVHWPIGNPYDLTGAPAMLTMTAAAVGPIVAALAVRRIQSARSPAGDLLGVTPVMGDLRRAIDRAAAAPFALLVEGESGSGKELVARAVHRSGPRRDRPFCTLNCAALPDDLIEAELFGHARGAFTGAIAERAGVFEEANGGTLFLDEVGELSARAQAKLLRVIQEGELRRIGENLTRRVDVRIVSATNRDLRAEVAAGRFRLDLLYRLDVVRLVVPPLRDRREDIPLLAERCWREATTRLGSRAVLGSATIAALARYDWPGNVRELQNVLAALAVRTPRRGVVLPAALPQSFGLAPAGDTCRLTEARRSFEERFVRAALVRSGGHRARAAAELGVSRQGLTKLMTRLGIADPRPVATAEP